MKKRKILLSLFIMFVCFIFGNSIVKADTVPTIQIKDANVKYGGNIYVSLDIDNSLKGSKIVGSFSSITDPSENGGLFSIELKDTNTDNPYFETSSYMQIGHTYSLNSIHIGSETYVYPNNNYNKYFETNGHNYVKIEPTVEITNFNISGSKQVTLKDKLKLTIDFAGAEDYDLNNIGVSIRNYLVPNIFGYTYMQRISGNQYQLDLPNIQGSSLTEGTYYFVDINVFPKNGGIPVTFTTDSTKETDSILYLPITFDIVKPKDNKTTTKKEETKKTESFLKKVTVKKTTAKINEKVGVELDTKKNLTSATLIFSNDKESMTVTVKKLNTKDSYFVIPFTTNSGNYTLDFAVLKDIDGKEYQYRKGENYFNIVHFDFNSTIAIDTTFKDGDSLSLDNSKITGDVIQKIKELKSNVLLEINANENPLITKEMFEAIKDSNKTIVIKYNDIEWTFNGLDVKTIKPIDVSTNIYNVSKDSDIKSKVKKGLVLDFANNDKLPGKCLIKLYNTEELNTLLGNKNANIYYYNEETSKFEIIKLDTKFNKKGYYEFYINHNSKYLITNDKIDDAYITNNKANTTNKFSLDLNTILIIGIPSLLVIIILIVILIVKSKRKKKQIKSLNNNEKNINKIDDLNIDNKIIQNENDIANNNSNDNID